MATKTNTTKTLTVTYMEVHIRGYELRTIGANRTECIATFERELAGGGFGRDLAAWASDNPEYLAGHASPLEAWIEYAGAFCSEVTTGQVTYP
jgi:hypothetical protein